MREGDLLAADSRDGFQQGRDSCVMVAVRRRHRVVRAARSADPGKIPGRADDTRYGHLFHGTIRSTVRPSGDRPASALGS